MNPWQTLIDPPKIRPGDCHEPICRPKKVRRPVNGRPPKATLPVVANPWGLTPCHCAVMSGVNEGLTNAQLAERLGVSEKMIEQHLREARARMGVHGRIPGALKWDHFIRGLGQ